MKKPDTTTELQPSDVQIAVDSGQYVRIFDNPTDELRLVWDQDKVSAMRSRTAVPLLPKPGSNMLRFQPWPGYQMHKLVLRLSGGTLIGYYATPGEIN